MEAMFSSIKKSVCPDCGRDIQKDFIFCPWCGSSANKNKQIENIALHRENMRLQWQEEQLRQDAKILDELEKELTSYVLCAQLSR